VRLLFIQNLRWFIGFPPEAIAFLDSWSAFYFFLSASFPLLTASYDEQSGPQLTARFFLFYFAPFKLLQNNTLFQNDTQKRNSLPLDFLRILVYIPHNWVNILAKW